MSKSHRISKGDIRKLNITSLKSGESIDMSNITKKIVLYEDLFSHHMTCNIEVADGIGLRSDLPITGGERIGVDIGERAGAKSRELRGTFRVFRVSPPEKVNMDLEGYVLNLVTSEHMRDPALSVTTSFKKPIFEIIQDVVKTHYTPLTQKKLVSVETTTGIHSFVPTGISPSAFIYQLCREAESKTYPSSIFVFYETFEGYVFATLEALYAKEAKYSYVYDMVSVNEGSKEGTKNEYQILKMESMNNTDLLGADSYNTQTFHFDPLTKTFRAAGYDYNKDFKAEKKVNKVVPDKVLEKEFASPRTSRYIITDAHRTDYDYVKKIDDSNVKRRRQDFMDRERAVMQQYSNVRLMITIPGNSNLVVGNTIDILIPSSDDSKKNRKLNDKFLAGKYLISAISHSIEANGEYVCFVECIRPGFEEDISS